MACLKTLLPALAAMVVFTPNTLDARSPAPHNGGELRVRFAYDGVITVCTDPCDSIASVSVGATLSGEFLIQNAAPGAFAYSDMQYDSFEVYSDDAPEEPYDWQNPNPKSANPLPVTRFTWFRESLTSAGINLTTGGTIDANGELVSGTMLYEFGNTLFSDDDAWLVFDISSGTAQLCFSFQKLGCIAAATQIVVADGSFSRLGPDNDRGGKCERPQVGVKHTAVPTSKTVSGEFCRKSQPVPETLTCPIGCYGLRNVC